MEPQSFDVAAVRTTLADTGLVATASLGLLGNADISGENPDVVAADQKLLMAAVDASAEIGATHLRGVPYGAMKKHIEPLSERGRASSIQTM